MIKKFYTTDSEMLKSKICKIIKNNNECSNYECCEECFGDYIINNLIAIEIDIEKEEK